MLIGRERERGRLEELLAEPRGVVVVGEAGVGKTALVRDVAAASGRRVFEGGGLATLSWMPLLPIRRALGAVPEGDAPYVAERIERGVGSGILFVDDLQWADQLTRAAVALLAGRVRVVTAVRRGDPDCDAAVASVTQFARVDVEPLQPDDAAEVVRRIRSDLPPAAVAATVARAGGNPLLLHELAATGEPSDSLRLAIAARLRNLSPEARYSLARLALLGRPADRALAGDGAEALVEAALATRTEDGYAIRHALVGETVAELLDDRERRSLHSQLAALLDDEGEAARHHLAAREREQALEKASRAAASAATPGERAAHLAVAAESADGEGADRLRVDAAVALFDAREPAAAARLLDACGDLTGDSRAWAAYVRAGTAIDAGDAEAALAEIDAGLEAARAVASEAEVHLLLTRARVAMHVTHDLADARARARDAYERARKLGVLEHRALFMLGSTLGVGAGADDAAMRAHLLAAAEVADAAGDGATSVGARYNAILGGQRPLAYSATHALPLVDDVIARARDLRMTMHERQARAVRARILFHDGRYDAAIDAFEELLREPLHPQARYIARGYLVQALTARGELERAHRHLGEMADDPPVGGATPVLRLALVGELELWRGRPREARAAANAVFDPRFSQRTGSEAMAAATRAWASFFLGDRPPAAPAFVSPDEAAVVAYTREIGALRLLHERAYDAAAEEFAATRALWASIERRGELRTAWAQGEALRLAGTTDSAAALLEDVERCAIELGMEPLLRRVHRSLRLAGARRAAARGEAGGLTPREREILELVADGLSNPDIARHLGISRQGVAHAVASASRKLGASTRAQAAALAVER